MGRLEARSFGTTRLPALRWLEFPDIEEREKGGWAPPSDDGARVRVAFGGLGLGRPAKPEDDHELVSLSQNLHREKSVCHVLLRVLDLCSPPVRTPEANTRSATLSFARRTGDAVWHEAPPCCTTCVLSVCAGYLSVYRHLSKQWPRAPRPLRKPTKPTVSKGTEPRSVPPPPELFVRSLPHLHWSTATGSPGSAAAGAVLPAASAMISPSTSTVATSPFLVGRRHMRHQTQTPLWSAGDELSRQHGRLPDCNT